jgi:hypothetical protein
MRGAGKPRGEHRGRADIGFNAHGIGVFGSSNTAVDNDVSEIYGGAPGLSAIGFLGNACSRCVFEGNRLKNSRLETTTIGMYVANSSDVLVVGNRFQQWQSGLQLGTGKYRDNLAMGCPSAYSGGINAGNNQ